MNKFIETKIKQKAKWVTRRYPELSEKDLIQEGHELIIKLQKSKGKDIPVPYLLKALSFHFSNLMRNTNTRRNIKLFDLLSLGEQTDFSIDREFQDIENGIDRERFIESIKDNNLKKIVTGLIAGLSLKETAERNNISIRTAYRHINALTRLRKVWEK